MSKSLSEYRPDDTIDLGRSAGDSPSNPAGNGNSHPGRPASFFTVRASFQQNHPRESDPFASRRVATRPSRTQALRWMGRYA